MLPPKMNGGLVTSAKWNQLLDYLRRQQLVHGAGIRLRQSCTGTVIEAVREIPEMPEFPSGPFSLHPDVGAGRLGIGPGSILYRCGAETRMVTLKPQLAPLPAAPGDYLLTLLCQYDCGEWHRMVWLTGDMLSLGWRAHAGLHRLPVARLRTVAAGDTVRIAELTPYCASLPIIDIPDFPFRATMWCAAPEPFSVCSQTDLTPTKLLISGGAAPFVKRGSSVPANPWTWINSATYTIGDNTDTLDGLYFLRLESQSAGICVSQCSLPNLAANGGPVWDEANGRAHIPICRVTDLVITQYAGYAQYALPCYAPES